VYSFKADFYHKVLVDFHVIKIGTEVLEPELQRAALGGTSGRVVTQCFSSCDGFGLLTVVEHSIADPHHLDAAPAPGKTLYEAPAHILL
jgi:hypothetical protein